MNNDIKFLNVEWRTPYPLKNFEDRFGLRASVIFLDSIMCGFPFIVIAIGDDYRFAFFGLATKLWLKFQGLFY